MAHKNSGKRWQRWREQQQNKRESKNLSIKLISQNYILNCTLKTFTEPKIVETLLYAQLFCIYICVVMLGRMRIFVYNVMPNCHKSGISNKLSRCSSLILFMCVFVYVPLDNWWRLAAKICVLWVFRTEIHRHSNP